MGCKRQICICDNDEKYAKRLADYFRVKIEGRYEVVSYVQSEKIISDNVLEYTSILITSDGKLLCKAQECEVFLLTENKFEERENVIYKYQSASIIFEKVTGNNSLDIPAVVEECTIKQELTREVQERLILENDIDDEAVYAAIDESINDNSCVSLNQKHKLRKQIYDAIRRYDILSELLDDEEITEVMINGYNSIYYEKNGCLYPSEISFDSKEKLLDIIQKIVSTANRTVNMSSPIVDARLEDGSRVNVVLEPVSLNGPTMTIRRFPTSPFDIKALIGIGAINEEIAEFLRILVSAKHNILISGGTGAGKTTMLNALSGLIDSSERIITIEDSAELKIQGISNLVRLETRNTNAEGCNEITVRDLIKTALRMRPDRIIVGEVRGAEAIDMLQAFNVGEDGSMSTIHANSAEDAILRLETLIMLNSDNIPLEALRCQISSGVDIIIQLSRQSDYSRKVVEIIEVTGMKDGMVDTNLLYEFCEGRFIKRNNLINRYKLDKMHD